ncbi:MAG TPA: diguanylate cyclase [Vicinamibacteria bacterium]|nr:diguanylate cyclase [Vicinamibacteria bacterium]
MKTPAESLSFRQSLLELLEAEPDHEDTLLREFERKRGPGDPLYSSLVYLLTHLNFTERQAARHWKRVGVHRDRIRAALGRDPGLRVAILDYFLNVSRELRNPKVIELALYERTERSAVSDGLTGLYNHAYFVQALRQEVLRSKRHGLRAALLLLDLDDFKRVNDERGHVEGDRVLMKAAATVRDSVREIDTAARYGGEEFAVLLPDTSRLGAFVVAERIRRRIEDRFLRARTPVTVSGGLAIFPEDASTPADLIVQADAGLYGAKASGKNCILLPQGERRRFRRLPAPPHVTLATAGGRAAARVKNLSEGGLLVSLREEVPVGSAVSLTIERRDAAPVDLRGEVVRVERVPGESEPAFDVGVRFVDPSGAEALLSPPR